MVTDPVYSTYILAQRAVEITIQVGSLLSKIAANHSKQPNGAPRDIACRELELQLRVSVTKLSQWKNLWFPTTQKSEDAPRAWWGQAGRERVVRLLLAVIDDSERILRTFDVPEAIAKVAAKGRENARLHGVWMKIFKPWKIHASDRESEFSYHHLKDDLSILGRNVDDVWTESELCFRRLYATSYGPDPIENIMNKVSEASRLSSDLYEFCRKGCKAIELDMNFLNNETDVDKFPDIFDWHDLDIIYHFVVTEFDHAEGAKHVYVELCLDQARSRCPPATSTAEHKDLCALLRDTQIEEELTVVLPGGDKTAEDLVSVKIINHSQDHDQRPGGTAFFEASGLDGDAWSVSSLIGTGERKCLAFRVVECGLLLLGTPWLSHLNYRSIRRLCSGDSEFQFSFWVAQYISETQQTSSKPSEQVQIYQIGVLLIEIALGTASNSDVALDDVTMSAMLHKVEMQFGRRYRQACEFCLTSSVEGQGVHRSLSTVSADTNQLEVGSKSLLRSYYLEVYLRLREVFTDIYDQF